MQRLLDGLSADADVAGPVLDKTGLTEVYVFYVVWDEGEEFLPAMQEQLAIRASATQPASICAGMPDAIS
jgi:hypothetical protein